MKKYYFLSFLWIVSIGFAQIPSGYYNTATGTGYTLKTQLYTKISSGYVDQGYSGLYTTFLTSDKDFYYENDGSLLDMYTENPTGSECFFTYGTNQDDGSGGTAECQKYNREHIIPQSVFSSATPMYSDAHFVVPSDKYVNAQRGNIPFGKVQSASNTYTNGSKKGAHLNSGYSAGYSGTVFEPIDEFKGDIARMIFYFITRYEPQVAGWSSYDMFTNTPPTQGLENTFLNILITWHNNDPVSTREIDRNNAVYIRQGNRNPYIDHPEYICQIWPTQCAALSTNSFAQLEEISVFPNPTNDNKIIIDSKITIKGIVLLNLNGQIVKEIKSPEFNNNQFSLENISQGFYLLRLSSENQAIIKKIIVN